MSLRKENADQFKIIEAENELNSPAKLGKALSKKLSSLKINPKGTDNAGGAGGDDKPKDSFAVLREQL